MAASSLVSIERGDIPGECEARVCGTAPGVELRVARWRAAAGAPARGTVLLLHGYSEFIEKYYEVIGELRERGYAVVTYDSRGQGLSTRLLAGLKRGYVTSFADLVDDALRVFDEFVAPDLPGPVLLMGHSMGGHVAVRLLQEHPQRFDRAVLSAPMLGWSGPPLSLVRLVAAAHCFVGLGGSYAWGNGDRDLDNPVNDLTSDATRFQRMIDYRRSASGLVMHGVTWRWVREALDSVALVMQRERIARIETPTLLASAGRDTVVSPESHVQFAQASPAVSLASFPDAMHEILQENDDIRRRFWDHFDRFAASDTPG